MHAILASATQINDPLWQTLHDAFFAFTFTPVVFIFGLVTYFGWITRSEEHPFLGFTGPKTSAKEDGR